MGKPTEMTIRDLLQEELRNRGVTVLPEWSIATPAGRLVPDMLLKNGAQYIVETKLGVKAKLLDAMVQLYEYHKYSPESKGAFAVLFPEELRRPWPADMLLKIAVDPKLEYSIAAIFRDLRPSQRFSGNLFEVADWIAGQVLRAPLVEADTAFATRVLRDAVSSITAAVKQLQGRELEDIFGGKSVFENILQYEEGSYPLEDMRQATTYLLVNQLLFYHVLTRVDASFPAVDEEAIGRPADLASYFRPVLKKDYSSIFGFDVASRLPDSATGVVKKVVMVVKALAPEKIRHDLLGKVFHELIPFEVRKSVAAFYTNNEAAEILAQLAIDEPDARVIDLAVGSGTLLVAAYRRKRELLQKAKGTIELEDHKRFLEQDLTGIDIMPFAAHLAVVHLSLQALLYETEKVRVAVWDSTELKPGQTIPAISSELKAAYRRPTLDMFAKGALPEGAYVTKGTLTMDGVSEDRIQLGPVDVVIMNPPFTRQERLPRDYKEALANRLVEYEDKLSGRLGLHGYFVLLADRFVRADGKVAMVLPATVLRITSTRGIRELLVGYELEHIITTYQKAAFSEGAQFREILLVAKKSGDNPESSCLFTSIEALPKDTTEARGIALKLKELRNQLALEETYVSDTFSARRVENSKLQESVDNIFRYIACADLRLVQTWEEIEELTKDKLLTFSDVLEKLGGRIEEGARARSNVMRSPIGSTFIVFDRERAIKQNDLWFMKECDKNFVTAENAIDNSSIKIPKKCLEFGLRRFSGISSIDLSDKLDFIVKDGFPSIEKFFVSRNIKQILSDLPKWRRYIERKRAKLAVADRFDISGSGTKLLAWYSDVPFVGYSLVQNVVGIESDDAKILTIWFNSTINALQIFLDRVETRGAWIAFRKYVMSSFLVLDPSKLSQDQRQTILEVFDEAKEVAFPSFLDQLENRHPMRKRIDTILLKMLGLRNDYIEKILGSLYPALANEIEKLKTLMAG